MKKKSTVILLLLVAASSVALCLLWTRTRPLATTQSVETSDTVGGGSSSKQSAVLVHRTVSPTVATQSLTAGASASGRGSGGGKVRTNNAKLIDPPQDILAALRAALGRNATNDVSALLKMLRDDPTRHDAVIRALAEDPLMPSGLRIWAMSLLKTIGGPKAVDALLAVFMRSDDDLQIRCYAAFCFAKMPDTRMVQQLLAYARDDSLPIDIRAAAILALKQFASDTEVQACLATLARDQSNPRLARLGLSALSSSTNQASVDSLAEGARASDYGVRMASVQSLGTLARAEDPAVAQLAQESLRDVAYDVIGELAPSSEHAPRQNSTEQEDRQRWMSAAVHALNYAPADQTSLILSDIYSSAQDDRLRQDVVSVAGGLPNDESLRALLIRGLSDPVPKVRMVSARSLLSLTGGTDISVVHNAMNAETNDNVRRDMSRALRSHTSLDISEGVTP